MTATTDSRIGLMRTISAFIYSSCEAASADLVAVDLTLYNWNAGRVTVRLETAADVLRLAEHWTLPVDATYTGSDGTRYTRRTTDGFPGNDPEAQHEDHRWRGTDAFGLEWLSVDVYASEKLPA